MRSAASALGIAATSQTVNRAHEGNRIRKQAIVNTFYGGFDTAAKPWLASWLKPIRRKRDAAQLKVLDPATEAKNREMMKLYREVVLGEKTPEGFVPLTTLGAPSNGNGNGNGSKPVHEDEVAGVAGD